MGVFPALRIRMTTPLEVSQTARVPVSLLTLVSLVGRQTTPPGTAGMKTSSASATIGRLDMGRTSGGRAIEATSIGSGQQVVLLIAALNGMETAGTQLLERLAGHLALNPRLLRGRRVILVPCANPDGLALGTRGNAAAVDLGRDFPASDLATRDNAPQPETQALIDLIERVQPARIITIHQPRGWIGYDGPARDLARTLGALGALDVHQFDAPAGSLGSWAGVERKLPVITLELPGGVERHGTDQLWQRYADLALKAISYR